MLVSRTAGAVTSAVVTIPPASSSTAPGAPAPPAVLLTALRTLAERSWHQPQSTCEPLGARPTLDSSTILTSATGGWTIPPEFNLYEYGSGPGITDTTGIRTFQTTVACHNGSEAALAEPVAAVTVPLDAPHAIVPWGEPEGDELWMARYVPDEGDLVEPSSRREYGHEQHGRRPALVVSNCLLQRAKRLYMVGPTRTGCAPRRGPRDRRRDALLSATSHWAKHHASHRA